MTTIGLLKERFDRDPVPVKWGGIASDLLRLSSMARAEKLDTDIFRNVLTETKLFTEWLAPQVGFEEQETILSLQRILSGISAAQSNYKDIETKTHTWSDKVLVVSGLLTVKEKKA